MDDKENELKNLYDQLRKHRENGEDCTATIQKIIFVQCSEASLSGEHDASSIQ